MSPARTAAVVIAVVCAVTLLVLVGFVVARDIESRLQRRRRVLALRRDVRAFEKGHQPW